MTNQKQINTGPRAKAELSAEDSPAVIAYRVGQLEKAVADGFVALGNKLEIMQSNFATKNDLTTLEKQASEEHKDIRDDILVVKQEVDEIKKWKDGVIGKIAGAAVVMLVLMLLAVYGLDKFFRI